MDYTHHWHTVSDRLTKPHNLTFSVAGLDWWTVLHVHAILFYSSFLVAQGYPQALLPLTVAGIPSIHICLDFIPELLAQPQLEKQVNPLNLALAHGSFPEPSICCPLSKACVNIHTDFCDSAAVPVVYSVRLTQISQCGQVSHQRHGDPPHRRVLLSPPLSCIQVDVVCVAATCVFGAMNKWSICSQCWPGPSGTLSLCPSFHAWWPSVKPSLHSMTTWQLCWCRSVRSARLMLPPKPEILTLLLPVSTTASAKLKKKANLIIQVFFITSFLKREINFIWFQVCSIWRRSLGRPQLQHKDCPSWACLRRQQNNWVELTPMSSSATVSKPRSWTSSAPPFTGYSRGEEKEEPGKGYLLVMRTFALPRGLLVHTN